ncbi:uracil-DNA glycosylase [Rhizobiaceae bacterium n13]|uniref:Type-4 uracil-DNA glycosylase n=1 Tax=Ferirhizobium litorale TaxID=2927786 RepID=A0AAE3QDJ1_9HYPH|nr:uracil-DNA glycosylase [Fererhizobium litorale]MDI7861234.1 uracil-DNA glycosylase [Fererhizobium litorale]MDI7921381.1 uracil-DNA glycosylase [Fererhizobium litorale]
MIAAKDLSAAELASLLHFHADAGVEWLLEDEAVDRFAEFAALEASRGARSQAPSVSTAASRPAASGPAERGARAPAAAARVPPAPTLAMPGEQAVAEARSVAAGAGSLDELRGSLEGFAGCNLKNSARTTVFASGNPAAGVMVIGPMPSADDDRDGTPFSGRAGQMLDRMLAAIGLSRDAILVTNAIPWRPPGDRQPYPIEIDICRPFIERQIELAAPRAVLALGNLTARLLFGGNETIHTMRGEWRELQLGGRQIPVMCSLHPQELLIAPVSKRLAWADLLAFAAKATSQDSAQ